MDELELNGWLQDNLAIQRSPRIADLASSSYGNASPVNKAAEPITAGEPGFEQAETSVRDVIIELREDTLLAYVVFTAYGMDLTLELEGRLIVKDEHLRLDLTAGRLGSLPLLAGTLASASRRLFDAPENREKFRLPSHIKDVRIEGGRLIVSSR